MADNLESFFKKHLTDETSGGDDWNMPSDSVWENALPQIQKKSGVFIPWKYLYLLGLISIVGFAIVLYSWNFQNTNTIANNDITELTTDNINQYQTLKTIVISDSIEKEDIVKNEITENNVIDKDEKTSEKLTNNTDRKVLAETIIENISKKIPEVISIEDNTKKASSDTETIINTKVQDELNTITLEDISLEQTISLADSTINPSSENNIADVPEIVDIGVPPHEDEFVESRENTKKQKKKIEPIELKGKIGVGIYFSPTITSTYLRGEKINGVMNAAPVFLYSVNYGLEVKYHISNKLAIVGGIGRSGIKSWSKSLVDFNYNTSTENTMPTGEKENSSPIPMPTPFGEINTEVTYRFSGSDEIPDGEIMQSELEIHQYVRYLSIPLGVEYNIFNSSRLSWFAEGGLGYNRAMQDATEFSSRIIHTGEDMNVFGEEMTSHPTYKNYYLNYYIGAGLSYPFSKLIHTNASFRYMGNITNINIQDNMSTNVHGLNLKIGIVYFF
ncbi:MAG: hypothetical protein HQ521_10635 [Bacteroidetes bacterium]|nr:hypothetical protein [Bacteroidota bacterium]